MFFQGRPCRNGHDGLRYVSGKKLCVQCQRAAARRRQKKWRKAYPELSNSWNKENRDLVLARRRASQKARPSVHTAGEARRNAAKLQATPAWADRAAIKAIYKRAAALGMHVDHTVPLRSPLVSGLHVEANLQLLPPLENKKKSNLFWPDMPV